MNKIYFQVIGPDKEKNTRFIEKVANRRFSILNDFHMTTEKEFDKEAFKSYLILTDDLDFAIKQEWMEYYYKYDSMELITEI